MWVFTEFQYYPMQMDVVTFKNTQGLPIDWELDDPTHEKPKRVKKDAARDESLTHSVKWQISSPPIMELSNYDPKPRPSWVVFRLPYRILYRCVDMKTNTFKRKKNNSIIEQVFDLVRKAYGSDKPDRIVWPEDE